MRYYIRTRNTLEGQITTIYREDGAQFPLAESNPDYREYLEWVAAGNTAEPFVEPSESGEQ